jgi:hypothetical protein
MDETQSQKEKTRGELLQDLEAAQQHFETQPDDVELRFALAKLLLQAGEFWQADEIARHLMENDPSPEIQSFMANLAYLLGNYARAEEILRELIPQQVADPASRVQSEIKLLFTYYQTNQFANSQTLFKGLEGASQLPQWQQMKAFGDERPYQIDWQDHTETVVPFLITDPLPIIEVEIQGKQIYCLIDTGGDNLYLDNEYAAELGIEAVASAVGQFGGGMEGKIGFAKGSHLRLGGVTLNPVPITIMPTQRWSKGFADGKYTIGGVIGTSILKQFLATMDYPAGKLVLRQRTPEAKQAFFKEYSQTEITEIPFALWMTHHMLAKGSLNEYAGLTYFVDSGLSSPAAFIAPLQTLEYTGIPVPETEINEDGIGGGGEGLWATGSFPIQKLGLGPLTKENVLGNYGTMTPETYWQKGLIQDGLISHQFLRDYRWTLDFDEMKYYFIKP